MKKNIILFSIVFIAAMVIGPIFAGAGTLYGVKHPPSGEPVEVYEIDLSADPATFTLITEGSGTPIASSSYNGAAYDAVNDRFYFTLFNNTPRDLWMITDFTTTPVAPVVAGTLTGGLSNGTFYNGKFYYIGHNTDTLYEVSFDEFGYVDVEQDKGSIGEGRSFYFGDISYGLDGVLYGSSSVGSAQYFFTYNNGTYAEFGDPGQSDALQIAFADDGKLYGFSIADKAFYEIDKTNGTLTFQCNSDLLFSDLASKHNLILDIGVDIKPGSYPNSFNLNGNGVIPVAILGSETFDALEINPDTLIFAGLKVRVRGKKGPLCNLEDVSGDFSESLEGAPDGYLDLVCQFEDDPDAWVVGESGAEVTGQLYDGTEFTGSDTIRIVPE